MTDLPDPLAAPTEATTPEPDAPDVADPTGAAPTRAEAPEPDAPETMTTDSSGVPVDAVPTEPAAPGPDAPEAVTPDPGVANGPPRRRRSIVLRFVLSFMLGVVLVAGIGAGALYAWGAQYEGRVLPGVRVGQTDLSGFTRGQAEAAVAGAYASLADGRIVLSGPDGPLEIAFSDIGRAPDTAAILDSALDAGRGGEPLATLIGPPQAALHGLSLPAVVTYDRARLVAAVDRTAASIDRAASNASVTLAAGSGFAVVAAEDGRAVDTTALLAALDPKLTAIDAPSTISLDIPIEPVPPAVPTAAADAAKAGADRMTADLVLTHGSDRWTIASTSLRPLISFAVADDGSLGPSLDGSGLDPLLAQVAKQANQSAQDAGLRLVAGRVVATGASRDGRSLDVAATKAAILAQMAARLAGTAVEPLPAAVKTVAPRLSSELAAASAPSMVVIGQHTTWFSVWIGNGYGANIWVPTKLIDGYVVPPGQTFDFWKVVGNPSPEQGFTQGNAIINGRTSITGAFAGGICSCSTTLFNAALQAGLKLGARQNHYYFIPRYPTGLDATVWISGGARQSMSFTNDTPYPLLIQGVNSRQGSIGYTTFKIWSVPNGRKVIVSDPVVKNYTKAKDSVVYTSRLRQGQSERVQDPEDGFDAWRTVSVYQDGALLSQKTYYSHYANVTGVVEVGTAGPAPTPTPAPTPVPSPSPAP